MKLTYFIVNFSSIFIPFIYSFHRRLRFNETWKAFLPAVTITGVLFVIWDIIYTKLGVWAFNPAYLSGIYFYNLPLEELLFFFCIPYACVFTYHCLGKLIKWEIPAGIVKYITMSLLAGAGIIIITFNDKLYTLATFALLLALLTVLHYLVKVTWLGRFYFSFIILLVPFLVVNGFLTGTGPAEPVVSYNENEYMGVRILTIPLEDFFYALLLLLTNVSLYEYFKRNSVFTIPGTKGTM